MSNNHLERRDGVMVSPLSGDDGDECAILVDDRRPRYKLVRRLEGRRVPPLREHSVRGVQEQALVTVYEHLHKKVYILRSTYIEFLLFYIISVHATT